MITPESLIKSGLEDGEQSALFCWYAWNFKVCPHLEYAFAVPNGEKRDTITAARLKRQGVRAGVPDVVIPSPQIYMGRWHAGAFLEMKKIKGGNVKEANQLRWKDYLISQGYAYFLCLGFEAGRKATKSYFGEQLQWRDVI